MSRLYLLTALGAFVLGVASTAAVGSFLFKPAPAPSVTVDAALCPGKRPTAYYMEEVAPTLPEEMRNPFRMPVIEDPSPYQGALEPGKLDGYSNADLECWAFQGDKIAAYALDKRERSSWSAGHDFVKDPLMFTDLRRSFILLLIATSECRYCNNNYFNLPLLDAQYALSRFLNRTNLSYGWSEELDKRIEKGGRGSIWYQNRGKILPIPID